MAELDATPRVRRRYNRDAEVLAAAINVFWRKGFAAATIQDIADEVGVLKGSLYHYVQSKEELLFRIFDESHRQASEMRREVVEMELPPIEALHLYVEKYVLWYLQNMERVSLYFSEWKRLSGDRLAEARRHRRTYDEFVSGLILDAEKAGEIPSRMDAKYATYFVLGALNGIPDWYRRDRGDTPETIAAVYADLVVATLKGSGPTR
jgi:AcrR family transcriptional regulator